MIKRINHNQKSLLDDIDNALRKDGVVVVENFISEEICDQIAALLEGDQLVNSNDLTFINVLDSRFFSNAMAKSPEVFDLITSNTVTSISRNYLSQNIRLKCHRVYSSKGQANFPWHTDNKFDGDKNNVRGIVFIVYLVDTSYGATEFVIGSHKESHNFEKNNFTDQLIQKLFKNKIFEAPGKKGTVVISDTKTIHRGGISKKSKINRKSLWFQVENNLDNAERLLINPAFLPKKIDTSLKNYLGFSLTGDLSVHPVTPKSGQFTSNKIRFLNLYRDIILIFKIPLHTIKLYMPRNTKNLLRKFLGLKNDWNK